MQQTLIKKSLSYLFDIGIESISSDYNESLDLVLSHGRYQLLTKGAIYSYEDKYDNFKISFKKIDLDKYEIENVLILGLGMASIPIILERVLGKSYHYTGVEIDEAVIYLTSKYILDDLKSTIEIIQTDANIYMNQNTNKYDMVCMDVFIDDKIPDIFQTIEFLEKLKDSLSTNAVLLFNWLAVSREDIERVSEFYNNIFLKVFSEGQRIKLANNWMLVGEKQSKTS